MISEKIVCTINGHYMGLLPFSIFAELDGSVLICPVFEYCKFCHTIYPRCQTFC